MPQPYKQVSPEQVEIWLNDPVTKAYLDCMDYYRTTLKNEAGSGKFIDPSNNDLTCYNMAFSTGQQSAFAEAGDPAAFLARYERPEVPNAGI